MKNILVVVFLSLICASCDVTRKGNKYSFWKDLYPDRSDEIRMLALSELDNICRNNDCRKDYIEFIINKSRSKRLSIYDNYSLAQSVFCIMKYEGKEMALNMLSNSKSGCDVIGIICFNKYMYSPEYFEFSCLLLDEYGECRVRLLDHDGTRSNVQLANIILRGLEGATGKDYGFDVGAWLTWWSEEGIKSCFDPETMKYKKVAVYGNKSEDQISTEDNQ